ncbi:MAG: VWA domain-containing protein [Acidobacteriota bacterium]|nr:VWA domain-containing protein [Blastocatellia bacterium]MDW8412429.1 VWA domain-containing protein [Acidobacteriota bacterium]
MEDFRFKHPEYLYLILLLPLLALVIHLLIARRRKAMELFCRNADRSLALRIHLYRARAGLTILVFLSLLLALARPQWGAAEGVKAQGVDMILAVDVSLSMLADDELPSRLDRARRVARDVVDHFKSGRIGVIAFAGSSSATVPLTFDVAAVHSFLKDLNVRLADVPGTSVAGAIRRAVKSLKDLQRSSKLVIVVSDGEDQDDAPLRAVAAAAKEAAEYNVVIVTVGIGSTQGSTIPLGSLGLLGVKRDSEGKVVITRLEEETLKVAAETTGGIYLRAEPNGSEVNEIIKFVERMKKGEIEVNARDRKDRYHYPLCAALVLLLVEMLILRKT